MFAYLNAITAGLIAILLFACYIRRSTAAKKPQPPKAAGAWPIIGHLPLLTGSQVPHISLGALADKYGPIFTIQIGIHQALVVSSWELAKEIFTTNDIAVSGRPNFTAVKYLGYDSVMFGFAPYGDYWREMRKIISVELFCSRQIELRKHVIESEVETSIKELHKFWTEKEMAQATFHATAGSDRKEVDRCRKAMREFFDFLGLFVLRDAIPFLGWLDVGGHEKCMKKAAKNLTSLSVNG
ncbi:hypothetical protein GH714_014260 [Hevea brasiliensis]|uniref:Cytochrome P450 n=1 Tax=Hevea brasiliensis TaxID=3981 RepID=A0A6A6NH09_HEVBR|nr:hypothetical protein GH714_014260 [Hevea brasiliensis]